ncbi:MAG: ATP-dependent DNA helicase RecG [Propionibacteriaceae bacterium]|nr:ATP-dependent DNA helicase RecG [Propionibacteriaceae bacterium]
MGQWKTAAFRELQSSLTTVLGAATAKAFLGLQCSTLSDLLRLLPRHLMSGTDLTDIAGLIQDNRGSEEYVALMARVARMELKGSVPRQRLEVRLTDGKGWLTATFFGRASLIAYWQKALSRSDRGIFAGKLGWFNDTAQLAHPAFVMITPEGFVGSEQGTKMAARVARSSFIGLYPQTSKLATWTVAESIDLGLAQIAAVSDPMPGWVADAADVVEMQTAFRYVHAPTSLEEFEAGKKRLLFDEAFAAQTVMAYRRADSAAHPATPRPSRQDGLRARFDARLPFTLTEEQVDVGRVIEEDLARSHPMQRLLQGEVGSGKTVVALRAMLTVVDAGGQAVLLAPTEVLAAQHAATITALMGDLAADGLLGGPESIQVVLLTGSMTAAAKGAVAAQIASGQAGIIIGTHAVLSRGLSFADLGLVVIDEQHRFGVEQRSSLSDRGPTHPHSLVMTATPIPRSVAMTVFGDLDVSTLTQLPAGRGEVTTTVVDQIRHPGWVERAWQRAREEVAQGHQVYVVAPRIDPTDADQGASVTQLAQMLTAGPLSGVRLAVLHSRLPSSEKAEVMAGFAAGTVDVLVATSMIEVGLDQPNASMMIIVDAQWFGVSQLHQLRGRIGRGSAPGVCLLLTDAEEGSASRDRLDLVASTRDGFVLANADLAQRREGDVLGTNQSGRRGALRLLSVLDHAELIQTARDIAAQVVARDPQMTDPGVSDYVSEIVARADLAD